NFKPAAEEFFWLTQNGSNPTTAYYFLAICLDRLEDYPAALENYKRFLMLADPVKNKLEIEKVQLRLPGLEKQAKSGKSKKS
ncbi:MAG TPA: hypothetical protein VNK26_03110, partial [Pyrinomonadaceae bacterium]|nr:hypothetical protein [Pyrinomonadaceae bacterium]